MGREREGLDGTGLRAICSVSTSSNLTAACTLKSSSQMHTHSTMKSLLLCESVWLFLSWIPFPGLIPRNNIETWFVLCYSLKVPNFWFWNSSIVAGIIPLNFNPIQYLVQLGELNKLSYSLYLSCGRISDFPRYMGAGVFACQMVHALSVFSLSSSSPLSPDTWTWDLLLILMREVMAPKIWF